MFHVCVKMHSEVLFATAKYAKQALILWVLPKAEVINFPLLLDVFEWCKSPVIVLQNNGKFATKAVLNILPGTSFSMIFCTSFLSSSPFTRPQTSFPSHNVKGLLRDTRTPLTGCKNIRANNIYYKQGANEPCCTQFPEFV